MERKKEVMLVVNEELTAEQQSPQSHLRCKVKAIISHDPGRMMPGIPDPGPASVRTPSSRMGPGVCSLGSRF